MVKTKQELIEGCSNEYDRKLIIKELNKFEEIKKRSGILFGVGIVLLIGGAILLESGIMLGCVPLGSSLFFMIGAGANMLKEVGL